MSNYITPVLYTDPDGKDFGISFFIGLLVVTLITAYVYAETANSATVVDISMIFYMPTTAPVNLLSSFTNIQKLGAKPGVKVGFSTVFAFEDEENERIEFYTHVGVVYGYSTTQSSIALSIGIIKNYKGEGSYKEHFISVGAGFFIGIDHSFDPTTPYINSTKSTSLTFGNGYGGYVSYDYYWYLESLTIRLE